MKNSNKYISGIEYAARMLAALDAERVDRPFDYLQDPTVLVDRRGSVSARKVG